jgi:Ca-activated chloride channel family protein
MFIGITYCLIGFAPAQEPVDSGQEPIRVDVNLVTLRFTARDATQAFVNNLTVDDFRVYENGRPRDIAYFERPRNQGEAAAPLWLALLIDVSGSTFSTRNEEILAAQLFFENVADFTKVGVFGFTDEVLTFQDFTSDRTAALDALKAAHPHLGRTAIYSSLNSVVASMTKQAPPGNRRAVILVSDGIDDNYRYSRASAALAREKGVQVFTIWVPSAAQLHIRSDKPGTGSIDAGKEAKEEAFARLAESTGGKHYGGFDAILDFDNVLAQINDELFGNLYDIAYYTDQPDLDRLRRGIRLEVDCSGCSTHGLFMNLPDRIEAKQGYIAALFDNEAISELGPGAELFHELGAYIDVLRPRPRADDTGVRFRLRLASHTLQRDATGGVNSQLGVIGILFDESGSEVVRLREVFRAKLDAKDIRDARAVMYTNRLLAPSGRYLLKLAVVEIPTWRMTVIERPVRVASE